MRHTGRKEGRWVLEVHFTQTHYNTFIHPQHSSATHDWVVGVVAGSYLSSLGLRTLSSCIWVHTDSSSHLFCRFLTPSSSSSVGWRWLVNSRQLNYFYCVCSCEVIFQVLLRRSYRLDFESPIEFFHSLAMSAFRKWQFVMFYLRAVLCCMYVTRLYCGVAILRKQTPQAHTARGKSEGGFNITCMTTRHRYVHMATNRKLPRNR